MIQTIEPLKEELGIFKSLFKQKSLPTGQLRQEVVRSVPDRSGEGFLEKRRQQTRKVSDLEKPRRLWVVAVLEFWFLTPRHPRARVWVLTWAAKAWEALRPRGSSLRLLHRRKGHMLGAQTSQCQEDRTGRSPLSVETGPWKAGAESRLLVSGPTASGHCGNHQLVEQISPDAGKDRMATHSAWGPKAERDAQLPPRERDSRWGSRLQACLAQCSRSGRAHSIAGMCQPRTTYLKWSPQHRSPQRTGRRAGKSSSLAPGALHSRVT